MGGDAADGGGAGCPHVGEIELLALLDQGAALVDSRTDRSFGGRTLPGDVSVPHDQTVARQGELDPTGTSVLFCNGPQCPQSPDAIRQLLAAGFPHPRSPTTAAACTTGSPWPCPPSLPDRNRKAWARARVQQAPSE